MATRTDLFAEFNAALTMKKTATGTVGSHVAVRKAVLFRNDATLDLSDRRVNWRHVDAQGEKPEHFHARVMGIDIHLRDGLRPPTDGRITGRLEINVRHVSNQEPRKGETPFFLYMNVDASPGAATARVTLTGERPAEGATDSWRGEEKEQKGKFINLLPV